MARKGTYRKRRGAASRRVRRARRCGTRRSSRRAQSGGQCGAPRMRRSQSGGQMQQSMAQGQEYLKIHQGQYGGGGAVSLAAAAPVGYTGMLDDSLRAIARVAPLDQANAAIQGMRDQSGGGISARMIPASRTRQTRPTMPSAEGGGKRRGKRNAMTKKLNAMTKKLNAMRKNMMKMLKKASRSMGLSRRRNMRGGAATSLAAAADYGSPGMLLSPAAEAKALMGMNPEWRLAENPNSFAPQR